jgi:8-oxo-dGTP diphosphatase
VASITVEACGSFKIRVTSFSTMKCQSLVKRLYPSQPVVGVGAVILCDGEILLEKLGNDPGRGKWSIPGGLIELGETPEESVVREVQEETGLTVNDPEVIDVVNNVEVDDKGTIRYHSVIIDYLVKFVRGTPVAASAALELSWIGIDEIAGYDLTSCFRDFIARNKEKLKRKSLG